MKKTILYLIVVLQGLLFDQGLLFAASTAFCTSQPPLSNIELRQLVTQNTLVGRTSKSKSVYILYFAKNGSVVYQRKTKPLGSYKGKWWIKNNYIYSKFPTYIKNKQTFKIHYYKVFDNLFVESSCKSIHYKYATFILLPGNPFNLGT